MYGTLKRSEKHPKSTVHQFMTDSSFHGIQYLAQRNRPLKEKIFWIAILLTSIGASAYLITEIIQKYLQSPVIITFQPSQTSVTDVPFPAVTVCPVNRFKKTVLEKNIRKFEEETKDGGKVSRITEIVLRELDHVCSLSNTFSTRFNYSINETTVNICQKYGIACQDENHELLPASRNKTVAEMIALVEAFAFCDDMIPVCLWKGQVQDCLYTFYTTITDMGWCCSFNAMPRQILFKDQPPASLDPPLNDRSEKFWRNFNIDDALEGFDTDQEHGTENDESTSQPKYKEYLKFQSNAGQASGLSFLLNNDLDEYFCDNHNGYGFRIYMHSLIELPHVSDFGIAVEPSSENFISIKADITRAHKAIRRLSVKHRECYFSDEHPLDSFNVYSASNCVDQCLAEVIAEKCNCLRIDMQLKFKKEGLKNLTFCEGQSFECSRREMNDAVKLGTSTLCSQCKPNCNRIEYRAQLSSLPLRKDFKINEDEDADEENGPPTIRPNASIVHVFFGSHNMYSRIRKNIYASEDLFAHVGGILGLFLGVSIMSLIEPVNILFKKCFSKKPTVSSAAIEPRETNGACNDQQFSSRNVPRYNAFIPDELQYGGDKIKTCTKIGPGIPHARTRQNFLKRY